MLEKVRKPGRGKAITAYVIFGAICLVFVFMGLTPQGTGLISGGAAAVVNDTIISQMDFRERVRRSQAQFRFQLDKMPVQQREMISRQIRLRALEDLIQMELLAQAADKVGVVSSDREVRDYILSIPSFAENGVFQRVKYDNYLKYARITAGAFEAKIRQDLSRQKMRDLFMMSLTPSPEEMIKADEAQQTKIEISFLKFDKKMLADKLKLKKADKLKFAKSDDGIAKVKQYYNDNKKEYEVPTQVKVSHILIKAKRGDKSAEKKAMEKIIELKKQIASGSFEAVAKASSEDTMSAKKSGSLGFIQKGQMVEEFEKKAFAMKVGEMSEAVQTQFGFHLLKVYDRKEGSIKKLEDVKMEIVDKVLSEAVISGTLDDLRESLKAGNSTRSFEKKFGLKWDKTGEFLVNSDHVPKLNSDRVLDDVLAVGKLGVATDHLVEANGSYFVAKLSQVIWPKFKTGSNKLPSDESIASRKASGALGSWMQEMTKSAKIQRNAKLVSQ